MDELRDYRSAPRGADDDAPGDEPGGSAPDRSLIDDLEALIDDGRTYLSAELSYQRTRASFVSDRAGKAVAFGILAAIVGLLAAIGLVVGLIIALTPHLTGWGATALVVGVLLLIAFLLLRRARANWRGMTGALRSDAPGEG